MSCSILNTLKHGVGSKQQCWTNMEGLNLQLGKIGEDLDKGLSYIKQLSEELTRQIKYSPRYFFMLPVKRQWKCTIPSLLKKEMISNI